MSWFGGRCLLLLFLLSFPRIVVAGGSGLNVIVVVNQNSSDSINLGNYYSQKRNIPSNHILRVNWQGNAIQWSRAELDSIVLQPLLRLIADQHLGNQIDYVVLSLGLPYRVESNSGNSTTSTLFYGFQQQNLSTSTSSCTITPGSVNLYAGREMAFRDLAATNSNYRFLVTMLTGRTYADAQHLVDQGVAADGTQPTEPVVLVKSHDRSRNVRYKEFDNAMLNTLILGRPFVERVDADAVPTLFHLFGFEMGDTQFIMPADAFVPGALADNLTSVGGTLFEDLGQTTLLEFVSGGASGSYGTVIEPCNFLQKFPDPQIYFYQGRGFNLAESYYQSVVNPYQGLIVGDPLSAPFARPGAGKWAGLDDNVILSGIRTLTVEFDGAAPDLPLDRVDLFVDGVWQRTVTNIAPSAGTAMQLTVDGAAISYIIPGGATRASIARDLSVLIAGASSNVTAFARGNRVELHLANVARDGAGAALVASESWAFAGRPQFVNSPAFGTRLLRATGEGQPGDYIQLTIRKLNGSSVFFGATNLAGAYTTAQLVQTIFDDVNNSADLLGSDGVLAQDYRSTRTNQSGEFTLRARAAGGVASQIAVSFTGSRTFTYVPVVDARLDENRADLAARNHLYVRSGATHLSVTFPLDSTLIPNGYHSLDAVAYEGTEVQTQTRASVPVQVVNSPGTTTGDPPIMLSAALIPQVKLSWQAISGRNYDVLASTALGQEMTVKTTVTALDTGILEWIDPDSGGNNLQRFYRVRVSP